MTETKSSNAGPAEVWITGIGLATSLGEGLDANWDALNARRINVDEKSFAPYVVHPWAQVNLDTQIPKKGDQRQMEAWQRIGTYAAGLALDSAGVKGNKEILGRMDMIVAAGGGERDLAVDCNILNLEAKGNSAPGFLNERLMNDLRPTLFLAQLSNLLAGNIAIVHGVTGSSRTFMGEEAAGVDAARIALARIAAGQSDIALVGGSQNGERKDLLVLYELESPRRRRIRAWVRRSVSCHGVQGSRASARRETLCTPDQRGRRSRTSKTPGRSQADT
jgi:3-oxoacyl-[acyl-carrier-protein] synthase II